MTAVSCGCIDWHLQPYPLKTPALAILVRCFLFSRVETFIIMPRKLTDDAVVAKKIYDSLKDADHIAIDVRQNEHGRTGREQLLFDLLQSREAGSDIRFGAHYFSEWR